MQSVPSINSMTARKALLLLFLFFIPYIIFSQPADLQLKKFSPILQKKWKEKSPKETSVFMVAVKSSPGFKNSIEKNLLVKIVYEYKGANIFLIKTTWNEVMHTILILDEVLFIDEQRIPKEELAVSNLDLSTDNVNVIFSKFRQYNGNGIVVSVKVNRPDTADIDF